jgi:Holliday junction resolvase RusA-like endonuclease
MGLILYFEVPGPPVPAARARVVRRYPWSKPHGITPDRTEAYEETVGHYTMSAMAAARWPRSDKGPFGARFDVYRAKDVGDWDNYGKAIADGMSRAWPWANDKYIHDGRVRLFIDRVRPRVEISVWKLDSTGGKPNP